MTRIHRLPGTTFSNTAQRGRYNSERRACLTLEELEKWLTVAICKDYYQSPHRGIDKETPMMRLNEGLAARKKAENGPVIPRDLHGYLIDFLPIFRRTLQRDGFTIDHIRYFSNALKPWISSREARVQGSMNRPLFTDETTGATFYTAELLPMTGEVETSKTTKSSPECP